MADAVTSQTFIDGPKTVVMKFTNISDGTGESGVTKVDVSACNRCPMARLARGSLSKRFGGSALA
jgi:hypothetical protein